MSGIKVLHFIWSASFGGIEKVVMDLCAEQQKSPGTTPALLIGMQKGAFSNAIEKSGFEFHYGGFRSGADFRPSLHRKLKGLMQGFDVIHLHTFNPLVFLAAISSGKPVVYTIHGNFNFGRKMRINDRINQSLRKFFFNRYIDHITFNSEFTKSTAAERYGLKNVKSSVIHNGIPLHKISSATQSITTEHQKLTQGKFVVGTSSRFAGFKRIDRLISAFSRFSQGKQDTVLLLVGDGILRKELEKQVTELGIGDKTIFTGFRQDVSSYQSAMDVCVFPSTNEPFGLVAVETLALAKPTLAFNDAGGMLEILLPEFKSDIVSGEDQLIDRLEYYYRNRQNQSTEASETRRQVAARYDISAMAQAMHNVYKNVIQP
jgi:L-malate glycosyltransferase